MKPDSRVLMKDGVWQVPASERPSGWELLPVREASPETLRTVVPDAGPVDIRRCLCGAPDGHKSWCLFTRGCAPVTRERVRDFRKDFIPEIRAWAEDFGADRNLELAARILMAGVFGYRTVAAIRKLTGCRDKIARKVIDNCVEQDLWCADGSVRLGDLDSECSCIEFGLYAMAASGELIRCGGDEDRFRAR